MGAGQHLINIIAVHTGARYVIMEHAHQDSLKFRSTLAVMRLVIKASGIRRGLTAPLWFF